MKRRDFIRVSSAAGVAAIVTPGFDAVANSAWSAEKVSTFILL
ncbi:MAG: twin-arginine translocation signal domain-containing protein [Draconibacterium sp.]|nr:twin-arginine translocation signal domain-containing protein [Draconibacterium sp.]